MINWNYIKGLAGTQYTFVKWGEGEDSLLPTIAIGTTNEYNTAQSLGTLVTTGVTPVFDVNVSLKPGVYLNFSEDASVGENNSNSLIMENMAGTIWLNAPAGPIKMVGESLELNAGNSENHYFKTATNATWSLSNNLNVANKCQAQYFNAVSDARAKHNFAPLKLDAVSMIQKMPLYEFDYNSDGSHSIGVKAQDVMNLDINGFSFVENKEATGENGDFMSVKESKLVYLLMQAIKQQQAEIDALKVENSKIRSLLCE